MTETSYPLSNADSNMANEPPVNNFTLCPYRKQSNNWNSIFKNILLNKKPYLLTSKMMKGSNYKFNWSTDTIDKSTLVDMPPHIKDQKGQ